VPLPTRGADEEPARGARSGPIVKAGDALFPFHEMCLRLLALLAELANDGIPSPYRRSPVSVSDGKPTGCGVVGSPRGNLRTGAAREPHSPHLVKEPLLLVGPTVRAEEEFLVVERGPLVGVIEPFEQNRGRNSGDGREQGPTLGKI